MGSGAMNVGRARIQNHDYGPGWEFYCEPDVQLVRAVTSIGSSPASSTGYRATSLLPLCHHCLEKQTVLETYSSSFPSPVAKGYTAPH